MHPPAIRAVGSYTVPATCGTPSAEIVTYAGAFGRYAHEALAVDPQREPVYLSEDASNPNGLFYRWTAPAGLELGPNVAHLLGDTTAGTLEAMAIMMDDGSVLPDVAYPTSIRRSRSSPTPRTRRRPTAEPPLGTTASSSTAPTT